MVQFWGLYVQQVNSELIFDEQMQEIYNPTEHGFDIAFGIPDFDWDPRHGELVMKKVTLTRHEETQEPVKNEVELPYH